MSTPAPVLSPAPVICAEMSPRVSHLLSVTPNPDYPNRDLVQDVSLTVRKIGGAERSITQTHRATVTRVAGGIREVSGGTPTLERRSPLLWLERDDSPQLPALNLKGIFLSRAFLVPVSRLWFLDCRSSTPCVPPAEAAQTKE